MAVDNWLAIRDQIKTLAEAVSGLRLVFTEDQLIEESEDFKKHYFDTVNEDIRVLFVRGGETRASEATNEEDLLIHEFELTLWLGVSKDGKGDIATWTTYNNLLRDIRNAFDEDQTLSTANSGYAERMQIQRGEFAQVGPDQALVHVATLTLRPQELIQRD